MKNKGISPLIATVVLITLVVVIAGIVYKFGTDFVTQLSPPPDCKAVSVKAGIFEESDGTTIIEIENRGVRIESLMLEIMSESSGQSDNKEVLISVNQGESVKQVLNFEISQGSTVRIIPKIKNAEGKVSSCSSDFSRIVEVVQVVK